MEDVGCFVGRREVVGGREETKNTNFEFRNYVIKILIWIRKIYIKLSIAILRYQRYDLDSRKIRGNNEQNIWNTHLKQ